MSVIAAATRRTALPTAAARGIRPGRVALHGFLIAMTAVWLFPLFWAIYSSLRPISDTIQHGYLSWPSGGLSLASSPFELPQPLFDLRRLGFGRLHSPFGNLQHRIPRKSRLIQRNRYRQDNRQSLADSTVFT